MVWSADKLMLVWLACPNKDSSKNLSVFMCATEQKSERKHCSHDSSSEGPKSKQVISVVQQHSINLFVHSSHVFCFDSRAKIFLCKTLLDRHQLCCWRVGSFFQTKTTLSDHSFSVVSLSLFLYEYKLNLWVPSRKRCQHIFFSIFCHCVNQQIN